ncbi:MAG: M56 family metallopeptidase [bacterium]
MWSNILDAFFRFSYFMIPLNANILVQSTVLAAIGLLLAKILRKKAAVFESMMLRVTLVALLLCPLASLCLNRAGAKGLQIIPPSIALRPETVVSSPGIAPENHHQDTVAVTPHAKPLTPTTGEIPVSTELTVSNTLFMALTLLWLVVAGYLMLRLLVAHIHLTGVRRRAIQAGNTVTRVCEKYADELGVKPPPILVTADITSPCLTGFRPAILLPESDPPEQDVVSREVLMHELAHLARRDCLWNFLCGLSRALIWYQPLLWKLTRRIEAVSDDVADDMVLHLGCGPHGYAQQLVEIAERYRPGPHEAIAGVGVISFQSSLGQRVRRILDSTRKISVRVGFPGALLVIAIGLCATVGAGLVGVTKSNAEPAEDASKYKFILCKDALVEFIGVCHHPSKGKTWWKPDGEIISEAPYESVSRELPPSEQYTRYEFAMTHKYLRLPPHTIWISPSFSWDFDPMKGGAQSGFLGAMGKDGNQIRDIMGTRVWLPKDIETVTVYFDFWHGEDETVATWDWPPDESSHAGYGRNIKNKLGVILSDPYEKDGNSMVPFSYTDTNRMRCGMFLVAIAKDGSEHHGLHQDTSGALGLASTTFLFEGLPLSEITRFEFRMEPYERLTFENVSLVPGKRTDVRVLRETAESD